MKKRLLAFLLICTIIVSGLSVVTAAPAGYSGTIKCSGSSALLPIVKQAADDFMKTNPKLSIQVSAGGSGTGLAQAKDGTVNIGDSDVFAAPTDGLTDHQIAVIPFLFITNKNVNVSSLTKDQLIKIFSGKITNWKEVGGSDMKIAVIMRQASSGTRMTIQQIVMGNEQFTTNAVVQDSNGSVRTTVGTTPGAIGYVDLAYVDSSVKAVKYSGVDCTVENVKSGKYTLVSIGHMYTKGEATGAGKAFIEYVQSPVFQNRILPYYKFVPVTSAIKNSIQKIQIQTKKPGKPSTHK